MKLIYDGPNMVEIALIFKYVEHILFDVLFAILLVYLIKFFKNRI